jgi:hypothetical protein
MGGNNPAGISGNNHSGMGGNNRPQQSPGIRSYFNLSRDWWNNGEIMDVHDSRPWMSTILHDSHDSRPRFSFPFPRFHKILLQAGNNKRRIPRTGTAMQWLIRMARTDVGIT